MRINFVRTLKNNRKCMSTKLIEAIKILGKLCGIFLPLYHLSTVQHKFWRWQPHSQYGTQVPGSRGSRAGKLLYFPIVTCPGIPERLMKVACLSITYLRVYPGWKSIRLCLKHFRVTKKFKKRERKKKTYTYLGASLVSQMVKNLPAL